MAQFLKQSSSVPHIAQATPKIRTPLAAPTSSAFAVAGTARPEVCLRPLALWHLLSLDAPCVACVWALFFAWSAGLHLSPVEPLALFLAVWLLYVGDRLLDAQPLFGPPFRPELAERHHFHFRHRGRFLLAAAGTSIVLLFLLPRFPHALLRDLFVLGCLLAGWLALVHLWPAGEGDGHALPKELAVGLFFPLATCLPTAVRLPAPVGSLGLSVMLFGVLCTFNCLCVFAWEHPFQRTGAHATTRWGARYLLALCLIYTVGTAAIGFVWPPLLPLQHGSVFTAVCSLSGGLLLLLHTLRHRIAPSTLRAAADLALLTPLPVILFAHAHV